MPKQRSTRNARKSTNQVRKNSPGKHNGHAATPAVNLEGTTHHREIAKLQIIAALPNILNGLIEKAKSGGYQQAKRLLDLCDVMGTDTPELGHQHSQQLCDALLDGLQFPTIRSNDLSDDHNIS